MMPHPRVSQKPSKAPRSALRQSTGFVHLYSASAQIPRFRLDDLVLDIVGSRPCLIKCDVEGAELFVLRGARRLLSEAQPDLLLSIHCADHSRHLLAQYGHTAGDVRSFLESLGYHIQLLASDHEEHWWCKMPAIAHSI